jgi:hypothetical protein
MSKTIELIFWARWETAETYHILVSMNQKLNLRYVATKKGEQVSKPGEHTSKRLDI